MTTCKAHLLKVQRGRTELRRMFRYIGYYGSGSRRIFRDKVVQSWVEGSCWLITDCLVACNNILLELAASYKHRQGEDKWEIEPTFYN